MFCVPVFCLILWLFPFSSFLIPSRCLKNFICAASKPCSSLFFSTQASLQNFNTALAVMLWILNFVSLFICFPKCPHIALFILLYVRNTRLCIRHNSVSAALPFHPWMERDPCSETLSFLVYMRWWINSRNSVTVSYNPSKMKASSIILEHFNTVHLTCKDHSVLFNVIFWMMLMSSAQVWHPVCSQLASPHLGEIWSAMRQRAWTAPAYHSAQTSPTSLTRRPQSQNQNSSIHNLFCEYFYTTITKTPHFKTPICHIWTI